MVCRRENANNNDQNKSAITFGENTKSLGEDSKGFDDEAPNNSSVADERKSPSEDILLTL